MEADKPKDKATFLDSPGGLAEKNGNSDCSTFGQSLIKFMSLATGNVKRALQKPANYKKNINHRRYLQKQLKICTRKKKRCSIKAKNPSTKNTKPPAMLRAPREMLIASAQGTNYLPFFAGTAHREQFIPRQDGSLSYDPAFTSPPILSPGYQAFSPNPFLKQASSFFFQAPVAAHEVTTTTTPTTTTLHEGYRDEILPDVFDENLHFMSGEELTQTLDIKDLFVPERSFEQVVSPEGHIAASTSFENNHITNFQTIPSTANVLSW